MPPAPRHPGSDYYVQPSTGTIQRQDNTIAAIALKAAGFQGPMTWDQAQGVLDLNKKVAKTGKAPITTTVAAAGNPPNPLSVGWHLVFGNTGGLLGRIIKVVLGAVLLISGILRMTGADKAALGVAGKAAVLA